MRFIGFTVTADVVGDRSESGIGEYWELMSPAIPTLGPTVTENDQRAGAR